MTDTNCSGAELPPVLLPPPATIRRPADALAPLFLLERCLQRHAERREAEHAATSALLAAYGAPERAIDQLSAMYDGERVLLLGLARRLAQTRHGLSAVLPPEPREGGAA